MSAWEPAELIGACGERCVVWAMRPNSLVAWRVRVETGAVLEVRAQWARVRATRLLRLRTTERLSDVRHRAAGGEQ